ncbi:bifunctional folylpolyglutamate synthase/dihydrofolate synthase [Halosquirtibacter xylanolyticus]|uniref:bifunctional folylpolyglutamate synthase/dihydrofolate synthase n=1 Tax=Halosquirtibacter xylanolyticus TaxID=3374599 RepID=UPI003748E54C|nr:bifunctional folylpolyglutamate synthase/dihydrofolate synthase [Prolixibacteraceae bacterium]
MRDYQSTLEYLYDQLPFFQRQGASAYKHDLGVTLALDDIYNHPHANYRTIHVAGTNGKGSVSNMIASILQQAGYKVGLYTSPHLKDFRERIRVNGEMISEESVMDFVEHYKLISPDLTPSFFEMTVAMAFDYFDKQNVDVAVIEVGMGGRLDSTNVIIPDLSVITNIGLDHTQFLGDTLSKVAKEKAGIIKDGVPVVVGKRQRSCMEVFEEKATGVNAPLVFADQLFTLEDHRIEGDRRVVELRKGNGFVYPNLSVALQGRYQAENVVTVVAVYEKLISLGYKLTESDLYNGLRNIHENTGMMGRWQKLSDKPLVVCDTAHNVDGIVQVVQQMAESTYEKLHFVLGMVSDKDVRGVLKLLPQDATYYFCSPDILRALEADELKERASEFGLEGNVYDSVREALKSAWESAGENDMVFVGGSNFVVAEVV